MMSVFRYLSIAIAAIGAILSLIPMIPSRVYDAQSVWLTVKPVLDAINAATKANIDMVLAEQIVDDAVLTIHAKYGG